MKKPLILLVDDDPAVLSALEAQLTPAFAGICRIEAFEKPGEVLDAVPGWEAERRSIALAIVDQKMPGLTGVELLRALRACALASDLKAVLLTGYAGLGSAIASKNEAAVRRYLEKPWRSADLTAIAAALLCEWLADSDRGRFHVFREITTLQELETLLRLRFEVYGQTPGMINVLPEGAAPMDIDEYDPVSRFFGLFTVNADGLEVLAGTLRLADGTGRPGTCADQLQQIVAPYPELHRRLNKVRSVPLPLMKYWPELEKVRQVVDRLLAGGEPFVEPGRFAVDAARAGGSAIAGNLGKHIIASAVADYCCCSGGGHAILTCVPTHGAVYRLFGFTDLLDTPSRPFVPIWGLDGVCLHGRATTIPDRTRPSVDAIATRLKRCGSACRCPAFTECLACGYASGDFRGVDVFCPELACSLLARADA